MEQNRGKFIVVEGLEGAGKSTALHFLKKLLSANVSELITTREPGGTRLGETSRQLIKEINPDEPLDARAELLLFYASRVQLIEQVIKPALNRGAWVLGDRFELSTFAYQGGGRGLDEEMIARLSSFCLDEFKPDLIFFLDVSPEKGLERAKKRGKTDRIEQESLLFFKKVYKSYHEHIKKMDNVVIINAEQRLLEVQKQIRLTLENFLHDAFIT
ncbi:dTMP kinase (plasmid) [Legionella adelaidensis]|uniref:Thymidylate kinase n=1 Tax=Legionella adelaidensis TaxID=45056 RepID=A0A0W0R4Y2_9GAMM|nr:dTMP kinase [Legionella adelaidensis]KTC66159.1 thymidylate kinase [Legionella adelaidensis]VEH85671.1 dTMP kinase [Legionella adelaidensis]